MSDHTPGDRTLLTFPKRKIVGRRYPTLTTIESDVKRMVNNAKAYNENGSEVYMDAERIRKMTSNFMVKANPAYKDANYVAFATPLPTGADASSAKIVLKTADAVKPAPPPPVVRRSVSTAAVTEKKEIAKGQDTVKKDEDESYEGKSFQEAQEMLIEQIIKHKDDQ